MNPVTKMKVRLFLGVALCIAILIRVDWTVSLLAFLLLTRAEMEDYINYVKDK